MAYGFNEDKSKVDFTYPLRTDLDFQAVVCKYKSSENKYRIFIPIHCLTSQYRSVITRSLDILYNNEHVFIDSNDRVGLITETGLQIIFTSPVDYSGYMAYVVLQFI